MMCFSCIHSSNYDNSEWKTVPTYYHEESGLVTVCNILKECESKFSFLQVARAECVLCGYTGHMNSDKHVAITMNRRHNLEEEVEKRRKIKDHCKAAMKKRLKLTKGIKDKGFNDLLELLSKNRSILRLLKKDLALPTFKPAQPTGLEIALQDAHIDSQIP